LDDWTTTVGKAVNTIVGEFINLIGIKQPQLIIMPKHPYRHLTEFRKVANFEHSAPLLIE
jgi:hypothetical protein